MKRLLLLSIVLLGIIGAKAQNPFAEYGYTPKIATLSKGQFNEFHDQDTIVQIGSVLYNTKSKQIVAFVETDTVYSEATLEADIVSRWISPDPLADHPTQIEYSPYHYAGNNPIRWTDPDGRCPWCVVWAVVEVGLAVYDAYETGATIIDPNASMGDKLLSAGGFALGAILPGGGYGSGAKAVGKEVVEATAEKAIKEVAEKGVKESAEKGAVSASKQIGPAGDAGAKVTKQIPDNWVKKTSDNKQGTKFLDPQNPSGNNVRVQSGNPKSPNAGQQTPYVKETKNGKVVDVNGKQVDPKSKAAHIPRDDFKYNKD